MPTHFPSLWFFRGVCMVPRIREPTVSSANPVPVALLGYYGSLSAMCWWCHWPTNGGRGQSRWGEGRRHLMLVVVCFVLLCFVLEGTFGWPQSETSRNGQLLCIYNIKSTTNPPKCYDMSFTEMVHRKMTGLNILTEMQFWLCSDYQSKTIHEHKYYMWAQYSRYTVPTFI